MKYILQLCTPRSWILSTYRSWTFSTQLRRSIILCVIIRLCKFVHQLGHPYFFYLCYFDLPYKSEGLSYLLRFIWIVVLLQMLLIKVKILFKFVHVCSPRNGNLNLMVWIKFLNLFYIVANKNWKLTGPNKVLRVLGQRIVWTRQGPEDRCSSC